MDSLYDAAEAQRYLDKYAAKYGEDLALRVYTSRLLGQDASLVLHGGGNTSVKSKVTELLGETTDVLYVKGSGWDLGSIEPKGFPACRLAHLRRCCERSTMTDEEMVAQLRGQMIDPSSPTPSVEALLHAYLPAKFVDHTHADAVLSLVDQPNSAELVEKVYGPDALLVPYVMPGFILARRIAEVWGAWVKSKGREPSVMILDKHGIFTWGETAEESYTRMIEAVRKAEAFVHDSPLSRPTMISAPPPDLLARIAPAVRGAMGRVSGRSWILSLRQTAPLLAFTNREDLAEVSQIGCVTPDHVIRTKPTPLVVTGAHADAPAAELRAQIEAAIRGYAERYHQYFERASTARKADVKELDRWPRVILFPGLGAITAGKTRGEAEIAADLYEHTAGVVDAAARLGTYQPVGELDLFDVEYWSLEQAKLGKAPAAGALDGKVALVTGAASGIGFGTARALGLAGAHVVLTDRNLDALTAAKAKLAGELGGRVHHVACDVTSMADVRAAVQSAVLRFGGLDVVVSNAGTAPQGGLHTEAGDEALRRSFEINFFGHQNISRAAADVMIAQGTGGAILFNASKSAFNQGPDFGPYAVPKAALVSLMRQHAVDLSPFGIRTGAVNADRIRTELFGGGVLEARAKARGVPVDEYFKANLLHRETTVEDTAKAFLYLATAEATTGCVITVDGGNAAAFPR